MNDSFLFCSFPCIQRLYLLPDTISIKIYACNLNINPPCSIILILLYTFIIEASMVNIPPWRQVIKKETQEKMIEEQKK